MCILSSDYRSAANNTSLFLNVASPLNVELGKRYSNSFAINSQLDLIFYLLLYQQNHHQSIVQQLVQYYRHRIHLFILQY